MTLKIACHHADTQEAKAALADLAQHYDFVPFDQADIIVALGGDGTMLEALHKLRQHKMEKTVAVYGMNCGSVGFLLNPYNKENLSARLSNAHNVTIYPLKMSVTDESGKTHEAMAFNEVSLLRQTRQAAKLKISVDGITRIEELVCDGILLATPAGSTAYNLSAHGPIIPLSANVLALTPISAFRPRRWRGALIPSHAAVKIEIINPAKRPVSATADSTEVRHIQSIEIRQMQDSDCTLLFDPDHHLEERILKEQFIV